MVLVVNRGAWVRDDPEVAQGMSGLMAFARESLPRTLLIFRASNMAHGFCRNYTAPRLPSDPTLEPSVGGGDPGWRWDFFPGQSQRVVEPIVTNASFHARGIFLDVFRAMQQRPDAHTSDCLHCK